MWYYDSPVGRISIVQTPKGLYGMKHNGVIWETCDTPQAEADNVFQQFTGCPAWDVYQLSNEEMLHVPQNLDEWIRE
ncbi:hypothetical protein FACS1894111_06090 [Clostridia bacterium]|nr:hypothetical protein FACS1894111_06090 [Clostridia bacterium]